MSAKLKIQYSYLLSSAISEHLYIPNNKVGPNGVCFGQVLLYNFAVITNLILPKHTTIEDLDITTIKPYSHNIWLVFLFVKMRPLSQI
jgi:hypothetical protein